MHAPTKLQSIHKHKSHKVKVILLQVEFIGLHNVRLMTEFRAIGALVLAKLMLFFINLSFKAWVLICEQEVSG